MTSPDSVVLETHSLELLALAAQATRYAVDQGDPLPVDPDTFPTPLQAKGATFVTLKIAGKLRGCIGSLRATEPLVVDIAYNAHGAVARDSRFPTVILDELVELEVSISVLSPLSPIKFTDEDDLLTQLRPGVDGLVIADQGQRSTFLPQVWDDLPEPINFLNKLIRKADLDPDQPSKTMKAWRYTVSDLGAIGVNGV